MQQEESLFKKPALKRRRPSLVCKETISDLDEMWESAQTQRPSQVRLTSVKERSKEKSRYQVGKIVSQSVGTPAPLVQSMPPLQQLHGQIIKTQQASMTRKPESVVTNHPDDEYLTDPMLDVVNQYEQAIDSVLSQDGQTEKEDETTKIDNDKYIQGLYAEFNSSKASSTNTGHGLVRTMQHKRELGDWEVPDVSDIAQSPGSPGNDFSLPIYQPFSNYISTSSSVDDFLIVKDEGSIDSDSATSDLDWESLTPPVPGSPSDHTVPDLDNPDMNTSHHNDLLLFSGFDAQRRLALGGDGITAVLNHRNVNTIDPFMDQSVPEFML